MSGSATFQIHSREFSWHDPHEVRERIRTLSGFDYLQAVLQHELPPPPMAELMGMRLVGVEVGRVVFVSEPRDFHYNPIGAVHGGFAATLLDSAMGCAVHTLVPPHEAYTTLEFKINLVRALTDSTGPVTAEGRVMHAGKRTAIADGRLTDAADVLYAYATSTCLLMGQ